MNAPLTRLDGPVQTREEIRDGLRIEWNVPIRMDDGLVLRADVFMPLADRRYPVILSYGPDAKGLAFQDGYATAWDKMVTEHPDVVAGSTNMYQSWEVVDPEKWVPAGYVCVRVDSRGCGCSPGYIDHYSPREIDGSVPLHRMGGAAALEQREDRGEAASPTMRQISGTSPP